LARSTRRAMTYWCGGCPGAGLEPSGEGARRDDADRVLDHRTGRDNELAAHRVTRPERMKHAVLNGIRVGRVAQFRLMHSSTDRPLHRSRTTIVTTRPRPRPLGGRREQPPWRRAFTRAKRVSAGVQCPLSPVRLAVIRSVSWTIVPPVSWRGDSRTLPPTSSGCQGASACRTRV
jgi:hypothetical protein